MIMMSKKLRGTGVAVITPFKNDLSIFYLNTSKKKYINQAARENNKMIAVFSPRNSVSFLEFLVVIKMKKPDKKYTPPVKKSSQTP